MTRFSWPEGKRCAVALSFDVDGETIPRVLDAEQGNDRLTLISRAVYGPAVGVPRILDTLREFDLQATFFVPGFTAELHPEMIAQLVAAGHEIGHHGHFHERPYQLSDDEEEAVLVRGIEALEGLTGRRPVGYRSPAWELKPSSPALLKRHGFRYDSSLMGDDIPYSIVTEHGDLLELPVEWLLCDTAHFLSSIASPEQVFDIWAREFDGYLRYNGCYILTLHPFVSGRPSRILLMERIIRYINERDDIWWATLEEIADYCLTAELGERWTIPDLNQLMS